MPPAAWTEDDAGPGFPKEMGENFHHFQDVSGLTGQVYIYH